MGLSRMAHTALVGATALLLLLPTVDWALGIDPTPPPDENRRPAAAAGMPTDVETLATWPARFEAWFRDHFGLRNTLIAWHTTLMLDVLGVSPTKDVLIGKDGWLYLGAAKNVGAYRCVQPYTTADLAVLQREHDRKANWARQRGIRYLHVWVPIKANVYPEFLPAGLHKLDQPCRLKQWMAHMQAHSKGPVLDLTAALLAAKTAGGERLYYKTDTHWNPRGAFVGYGAVARALAGAKGLQPLPESSVQFPLLSEGGGDLARLMDRAERYRGTEPGWAIDPRKAVRLDKPYERGEGVKIEGWACKACPPTRLLLLHDSFGNGLIPFLSESVGRLVTAEFLGFDETLIAAEKPDVIVELHLERQLTPGD